MPDNKGSYHFVDDEKFTAEVLKCNETGVLSDELGGWLFELAKRYIDKRFPNDSKWPLQVKQDFISEIILQCFNSLHRFKKANGKGRGAFSFFTQAMSWRVSDMMKLAKGRENSFNDVVQAGSFWIHGTGIVNDELIMTERGLQYDGDPTYNALEDELAVMEEESSASALSETHVSRANFRKIRLNERT